MTFFKNILGGKWRKRILILFIIYVILLLWPTIFFFEQIRFNAATFTQEWIKSISSISVIFLLLEYQKFIFELNKKKTFCKELLNRKIIVPLNTILSQLVSAANLSQSDFDKIILEWTKSYKEINSIDMFEFNIEFKNKKMYEFKIEYNLSKLNDKIISYISNNHAANIQEVIDELNFIVDEFNKEIENLN